MKILIVPLNWGLGHATRCIPLVRQYLAKGDEVILGGTGASLRLLHAQFPDLRIVELAPLNLHYSKRNRQVGAILRAIPQLIRFTSENRKRLKPFLAQETVDLIISDNCFGVYSDRCDCVYITHQLHVLLPKPWRWLEPAAAALHARLYNKYKEIWVPDYKDAPNLSGILGHPKRLDPRVKYIGPLSRFTAAKPQEISSSEAYDVVAVLSGLEPQRTLFEQEIIARYTGTAERVLIVRGLTDEPVTKIQHQNITLVPYLDSETLSGRFRDAKRIIARSGYSTIMDLHALGLLAKAELHPTPGQPEQEYLATIVLPLGVTHVA